MATKRIHITNGNLTADPVLKTLEDGSTIWEFTMAENHADNASVWFNFSYFAKADHPILKKAKKGASLQVFSKIPYRLNAYTFSHKPEKNTFSMKDQVIEVDWGTFDSPKDKENSKPAEEKEDDISESFFPKEDNLIPTSTKMKELEEELPFGVDD